MPDDTTADTLPRHYAIIRYAAAIDVGFAHAMPRYVMRDEEICAPYNIRARAALMSAAHAAAAPPPADDADTPLFVVITRRLLMPLCRARVIAVDDDYATPLRHTPCIIVVAVISRGDI